MNLPLPTWLVDRLIARAMRTPYFHLDGYMNRWWLVPYNRTGYAARVHQFLRSDDDRHMHNHPWPYVSIVLRGGYYEETDATTPDFFYLQDGERRQLTWYGPGSVIVRKPDHFHRVLLDLDGEGRERPCWTLFLTGPKRQDTPEGHSCWGFRVDGEFVPADAYLGPRYVPTNYGGPQP